MQRLARSETFLRRAWQSARAFPSTFACGVLLSIVRSGGTLSARKLRLANVSNRCAMPRGR